MRSITLTISALFLLAVSALTQTATASGTYLKQAKISQEGATLHIEANSPRPLAQVLDALLMKFGWGVAYEDPQYTAADVVDAPKNSLLPKLPSGAAFSVQVPASSPEEEKVLRSVVDSYNGSKNPGQFELRRSADGIFFVVGNAAHDEKGGIAKQKVLLDSPVTLATEERSVSDTVKLICDQLTGQNGPAVTLGVTPRRPMDRNTVKLGGTKVPARDLLVQALRATHQNLYWQLFYDPSSKGYVLSIHVATLPSA